MYNRFKLGRTLGAAYAYDCDLLLRELALGMCTRDGTGLRFNHFDTRSFAHSGEYSPASEEQAMTILRVFQRSPTGLEAGGFGTDGLS
jgi:hypothetical protein